MGVQVRCWLRVSKGVQQVQERHAESTMGSVQACAQVPYVVFIKNRQGIFIRVKSL